MKTRGKASDQVTIGFCLYRNVLKCTENSVENMHKQSENGERQSLTVVCHSETFCTQSIRTQLIRTQLELNVYFTRLTQLTCFMQQSTSFHALLLRYFVTSLGSVRH